MNCNLACASLDQSSERFTDIRMFEREKRGFNQNKATALADAPCRQTNIIVCLMATTAVANDQHAVIYFLHAAAPASANFRCAQ